MAGRFTIEAVLKAIDRFSAPIAKMQSKFARFSKSVGRSFRDLDRMSGRFLGGLKNVGIAAGVAGAAAGAAMANVVKTGADFEQMLTNAAAKFPGQIRAGTDAFRELRDAAAEVGATTEFKASQAAEGLNFLAMAGFDAKQSVAALPGVVDLATAAQVELGRASDIATDSLGAFGLMTKDAAQLGENLARVNDVIARTTTSANATVEDMFESIKDGAPVATSAGASIETFASLVGTMANSGIKGSKAGTTLKNVFVRLAAPANKGAEALKKLGVSTKDAQGNMRDVIDILDDLGVAMDGMGSAERAGFLDAIFGKRAIAGVNVLLDKGAEGLRQYRTELEGAEGASKDMAATMRDTTTGDLNTLKSAVEAVKIAVFGAVKGPFREIVQSLTEWTRANREVIASGLKGFVQDVADNLPTIVKWGKRIGIIVGVFTAAAVAVKVATAAVAVFNAVMALNPITAIALAIVGAIALILAFWPEISAFFAELWETIKAGWEPVKAFLVGAFEFVVGAIMLMIQALMPAIGPVFDFIGSAAKWLIGKWSVVKPFFVATWNAIKSFAIETFASLKETWMPIVDFFLGLWGTVADGFMNVFGWILDKVEWAVSKVQSIGSSTLGSLFGGGDEEAEGEPQQQRQHGGGTQVVSPQESVSRKIEESSATTRADVHISTDGGARGEVTRQPDGPVGLTMEPSGAF